MLLYMTKGKLPSRAKIYTGNKPVGSYIEEGSNKSRRCFKIHKSKVLVKCKKYEKDKIKEKRKGRRGRSKKREKKEIKKDKAPVKYKKIRNIYDKARQLRNANPEMSWQKAMKEASNKNKN